MHYCLYKRFLHIPFSFQPLQLTAGMVELFTYSLTSITEFGDCTITNVTRFSFFLFAPWLVYMATITYDLLTVFFAICKNSALCFSSPYLCSFWHTSSVYRRPGQCYTCVVISISPKWVVDLSSTLHHLILMSSHIGDRQERLHCSLFDTFDSVFLTFVIAIFFEIRLMYSLSSIRVILHISAQCDITAITYRPHVISLQ